MRLAARGGGRKYCVALRVEDRVCRANDSRKGLLVPAVDDRARGEAEPGGGAVQFPLELSGAVEVDAAVVVGVVVGDGDEVGVVGVALGRPVADGLDCYAFGAGDVAACLDVGLGAVEIEARVRPVAVGIGRSAEDAVIAVSRQVCPKVRRRIVCDAKPDVANAVVHHDKSILHVGIWFVKKMRRGGGGFYRAKRRRNGERRSRNGCGEPLDSRHRTETFGMSMFHYVRSFCFWFTLLLTTFSHFG